MIDGVVRVSIASKDGFVVEFDTAAYHKTAVMKAAYKFGDRCHILIDCPSDNRIRATLKAKKALDNSEHLAGEFCNEVLDQELREVVAGETEGIRNLILAQAFSRTSLLNPDLENADFRVDPCGIAKDTVPHNH